MDGSIYLNIYVCLSSCVSKWVKHAPCVTDVCPPHLRVTGRRAGTPALLCPPTWTRPRERTWRTRTRRRSRPSDRSTTSASTCSGCSATGRPLDPVQPAHGRRRDRFSFIFFVPFHSVAVGRIWSFWRKSRVFLPKQPERSLPFSAPVIICIVSFWNLSC